MRVRPRAEVPTMLDGAMHSAMLLTADLATRGFGAFGCDVVGLERFVVRYSGVKDQADRSQRP